MASHTVDPAVDRGGAGPAVRCPGLSATSTVRTRCLCRCSKRGMCLDRSFTHRADRLSLRPDGCISDILTARDHSLQTQGFPCPRYGFMTFRSVSGGPLLLDGAALAIEPGERIGLLGGTGRQVDAAQAAERRHSPRLGRAGQERRTLRGAPAPRTCPTVCPARSTTSWPRVARRIWILCGTTTS